MNDYIRETAIRKVRNDPVYARLVGALRDVIMHNGISELDIVMAARLAVEDLERIRRDDFMRKFDSVTIPAHLLQDLPSAKQDAEWEQQHRLTPEDEDDE